MDIPAKGGLKKGKLLVNVASCLQLDCVWPRICETAEAGPKNGGGCPQETARQSQQFASADIFVVHAKKRSATFFWRGAKG